MIKVGIIGGAGYTAGELLRILIHHPELQLVFVNSTSNAGNKIAAVHSGLIGETDIEFTDQLPFETIDALFFCTAHGDTKKFIESHSIPEGLKIIDLSTDYREESAAHDFVYGLPELNKARIQKATKVANPGCFATAIQIAILPLAKAGLLKNEVHVNAITGSTGAGQNPTTTSHFSWRNDNVSVYKAFGHQHLTEITQSIKQLQSDFSTKINFIPVRGNFSRGIFATVYTE
ncbi:MAG: N-acetyl-gamma-glutamyl-phosphate reductase, partial [Bacteroidales bacterium]|nr:N-acetyl-gamma-glutamyl-phosphate reductase [Bacteroidales bacterium]